jgi:hypothetical protein
MGHMFGDESADFMSAAAAEEGEKDELEVA